MVAVDSGPRVGSVAGIAAPVEIAVGLGRIRHELTVVSCANYTVAVIVEGLAIAVSVCVIGSQVKNVSKILGM